MQSSWVANSKNSRAAEQFELLVVTLVAGDSGDSGGSGEWAVVPGDSGDSGGSGDSVGSGGSGGSGDKWQWTVVAVVTVVEWWQCSGDSDDCGSVVTVVTVVTVVAVVTVVTVVTAVAVVTVGQWCQWRHGQWWQWWQWWHTRPVVWTSKIELEKLTHCTTVFRWNWYCRWSNSILSRECSLSNFWTWRNSRSRFGVSNGVHCTGLDSKFLVVCRLCSRPVQNMHCFQISTVLTVLCSGVNRCVFCVSSEISASRNSRRRLHGTKSRIRLAKRAWPAQRLVFSVTFFIWVEQCVFEQTSASLQASFRSLSVLVLTERSVNYFIS
jgi:hypothetical protein